MSDIEQEHQGGPDEVPTDEQLDVEGPNESTEPTGAPGLDEGGAEDDEGDGSGQQ
ncbi:MAG: hypothetical protein QOE06_2296 [Thermoleophilaceae bacterium]|jgi:hypothetical protein|nr:hypothetical protein [Thermoleophilaceae bacterium]